MKRQVIACLLRAGRHELANVVAYTVARMSPDEVATLPGVKRLVDTKTATDYDFGNAAAVMGGKVVGWHVTDDPSVAGRLGKTNFVKSYGQKGEYAELGPGFYVSAVPQQWVSRSRSKWAFLKQLDDPTVQRLVGALRAEIERQRHELRYISEGEYRNATRYLDSVERGQLEPSVLVSLASQPYNIGFWKPDWLAKLGVSGAAKPQAIKVQLLGTYAELTGKPPPATLRGLRNAGIAGVFTRTSMALNAELAVFHGRYLKVLGVEDV